MKKLTTTLGVGVLLACMLVQPAAAQVVVTSYTPQSQSETIAYLQGVIAQLQAQLQLQGNYQVNYQPVGQVQGATFSNQSYTVRVETDFVRAGNDDVELNGSIDLGNARYANVWFEYGDSARFGSQTRREYVTRDSDFDFTLDTDDLDRFVYYRAVAEDPSGKKINGYTRAIMVNSRSNRNNNDDEPEVDTFSARNVDEDSAELRGEVDMNDFRNGFVFFVYGEDENDVEDVEDEDEFRDIDERGDDLQKISVDSDLDGSDDYARRVSGLDDDTEYFFRICVEYEDEDDDETLECGQVEDFETDRN